MPVTSPIAQNGPAAAPGVTPERAAAWPWPRPERADVLDLARVRGALMAHVRAHWTIVAARRPSSSSAQGPHCCRWTAMPGYRRSGWCPARRASTYTCSSSMVSWQPASRGAVRRKRSSGFIGIEVTRVDELGSELAAGVVEGLVDGVARGAELVDEGVGGDVVED